MLKLSLPINLFYAASILYTVGFLCFTLRLKNLSFYLLITAALLNLSSDVIGRWIIWPFCNMFYEVFFLPLSISLIGISLFSLKKEQGLWLYPLVILFCILAVFFSEGYYPPFTLMSKSIFAHIFHLFMFFAHSFLFSSFFISLVSTFLQKEEEISNKLMILGYGMLCIAGLFGMTWSYVGRADTISWNHYFFHSIAIWLYYSALLHLFLRKSLRLKEKTFFLFIGAGLIFCLDILPQIGGIHKPKILSTELYEFF